MTEKGIQQQKYTKTEDATDSELKQFQVFQVSEHYDKMCSIPNQPGYLIATAKTCKFSSIDDITLSNLILRPVINLTGRYTCNASNVIPNHLKPLPERLEKEVIKDSYEDIS